MKLEIIPKGGIGHGQPIEIDATQVVVRTANGTPIALVMEYGPPGSYSVGMDPRITGGIAGDDNGDFERLLAAAGVREQVICDRLELPKPPPGAVLVADPRRKRV